VIDGQEGWVLPEYLKLAASKPAATITPKPALKFSGSLEAQKWYAGKLSRNDCKVLLKAEAPGCFLVWDNGGGAHGLMVVLGPPASDRKYWFGMIQETPKGKA